MNAKKILKTIAIPVLISLVPMIIKHKKETTAAKR
jgi:hypothetical protein